MRYLLVTGHRLPKFYKANGEVAEVELNYIESKTVAEIDEEGVLSYTTFGGTPPTVRNHWMVDSIEKSLVKLSKHDVFPYKSKLAAKENAKRLGLQSFKYIPVP
ncbi:MULTISPECIES: hypothetical protein [Photobacterium]|uniref:Uncharacterized protein n=1 Tax=Photobacterium iliopiscarium TaxID=56192 RepID=A0A2T3MJF1_9GAMM|nr:MULTISPECIES: hypothetical protein [Photobacterium]MCD9558246.1 hypothetical protein [Photobacterium carnosum]OBU37403.1 hypothetical protein AYY24_11290 [Photobacterium phosphoreum]PSV95225.1 hypothetical protein C9I88_13605 [Photobacterium iliopiscarium]PSW38041.1 hypothetical protein CTM87_05715 [Photobacterium phosphoreum]